MISKKIKAIALSLILLSSCARVPKEDLAQVSPPLSIDVSTEQALAQEFFEEGGWPTEQWWEMFEDPQLNRLIERALEENPTLQKAYAKVAEVEQHAKKERSRLFPHLNLEYDENWQYFSKNGFIRSFFPAPKGSPPISPTVDQIDLTLNFSYEFDFFGRNRNRFKEALGLARAQRAEAQMAKLMTTTLIAQTYIELQTKRIQEQILKKRVANRQQLYSLAASRGQKGLDAQTPVLEREQSVYEIEQSLVQIKKEISIDQHMLNILIGVSPDERLITEEMTVCFERPFPLPSHLSNDLLARRPDLTAQIWRVEAAAKAIGAAKADFYPRINLTAFAGLESLAFNKLLHISSKQGALEPALHLPIFTGGDLTANLKSKVAVYNEAVYQYNALILTASKEVVDQLVTMQASFATVNYQVNALEAAEDQLTLQKLRFQHAVNNFLTVLEREETVLQERYRLLGFQRDYLFATLKLVKALGGGYLANLPNPVKEAEEEH